MVPLPGAAMVFKALSGSPAGDFMVGEFTAEKGFTGPRPHVHHTHEEILEAQHQIAVDVDAIARARMQMLPMIFSASTRAPN